MRIDVDYLFERDVRPVVNALSDAADGQETGPLILGTCAFLAELLESFPMLEMGDLSAYCREFVTRVLEKKANAQAFRN